MNDKKIWVVVIVALVALILLLGFKLFILDWIFKGSKEVFAVTSKDSKGDLEIIDDDKAKQLCSKYGAEVATKDQLREATRFGAQWCVGSKLADGSVMYPMQEFSKGCRTAGKNRLMDGSPSKAAACFGHKPKKGTKDVFPFVAAIAKGQGGVLNDQWSMYNGSPNF